MTSTKAKVKSAAAKTAAKRLPPGFTRWDPVDFLKSEESMAAYLEAAIEEAGDDATFIAMALADIAKARGVAEVAKKAGLSRAGLYKALAPSSKPSFDTILKVMRALGLRLRAEAA